MSLIVEATLTESTFTNQVRMYILVFCSDSTSVRDFKPNFNPELIQNWARNSDGCAFYEGRTKNFARDHPAKFANYL